MSITKTAESLFQRAMIIKQVGGSRMSNLRQRQRNRGQQSARQLTGADLKDGDGDGVIFDGTPEERPVVRRMPPPKQPAQTAGAGQQLPPGSATGNVAGGVRKKQPVPGAPPKAPAQPKPKPTAQTAKPSPAQKMREASGKPPKPKTTADIVDKASGTKFTPLHTVKPKSIEQAALNDANKAAIHATAAKWTQKQNSKMAAQYQQLSDEVFNELPISRSEVNDKNRINNLDDDQKQLLKKAKEFGEKAALWAHFAENPEAAKTPFAYTPKENIPFDELMPLKVSSAEYGRTGISGPTEWDELDSYTQNQVQEDWMNNRMRETDFLEWVGESVRESVDAEDVIRNNIDDLLSTSDWSDLDVGQREVTDQIESAVKTAMQNGLKIGSDMTQADVDELRSVLEDASEDWKDGSLSTPQVTSIIALVTDSVKESEPGIVNIPGEDEIAEIIEIDEDDAVSQFYEAWQRGRPWARDIDSLIDSEIESRMDDDDYLSEYARLEWENLDSEASFQAATDFGYAESSGYDDYDDGETTSPQLAKKGIDDAASFVGAPEGTIVSIEGNQITVEGPGGFKMDRRISGTTISADYFTIGDEFKGQGTDIVGQMVRQAREKGFTEINVQAAGQLGGAMNGYYTWPLMGYERDIKGLKQAPEIEQLFPGVKTIQDLFDAPGGRDWWYVNGSSAYMDFDLSDGSRSMRVLERYLNEKRKT